MGIDLYKESSAVQKLFSMATEIAKFDVYSTLEQGKPEELQRTDRSQILITLVSLASHTLLRERGIESHAVAGFSLGEYAAMVDAGVLSLEDALSTVHTRGAIMETSSRKLDQPDGKAGMMAVIGLSAKEIQAIVANIPDTYCAIYNSPQQTVVSATAQGLNAATEALKTAQARRVIRLRVSGPFHCPLMQEASQQFAQYLESITFAEPTKAIYSNVHGKRVSTGSEMRTLCAQQLLSPVQWVTTEQSILEAGTTHLYEVGPGSVLKGLWKSFTEPARQENFVVATAGTLESIAALQV